MTPRIVTTAAAPAVVFRVTSAQQGEALRAGRVDGGFLYRFPNETLRDQYKPLTAESTCIAIPKTHPLAKRKSLRIRDLKGDPLIFLDRSVNPKYHAMIHLLLAEAGMSDSVAQYVNSSEVIQGLVAVGMGLGLGNTAMRWRSPPDNAIITLDEPDLKYQYEFAFARPNATLNRFIEVLSDCTE